MSIIEKEGFYYMEELNNDYLIVESDRLDEYVKYINKNDIQEIIIHDDYYSQEDIDFLKECQQIKEVTLQGNLPENLDGLFHLNDLQRLSLDEPQKKLDLSSFSELEELRVSINKNVIGIENCKELKSLHIWKYKPKSMNLVAFSGLSKIEELAIYQSNITDLTGIISFPNLTKLELYYCPRLTSIKQINEGSKILKELLIENCKKITGFEEVKFLKNLEKIIFADSGEVPSIQFISEMPKLKSFVFMGTNVIDGDLNPCLGLEYTAFTNKKHYTHKMKDFGH